MTLPLFHTVSGPANGIPLLLVHGWGGDGRQWARHAKELGDHFRVIVADLRGHGRSPVPVTGNTPAAMAADLAALVAGLAAGPVVAVGHSLGGQIVNLLAVGHPEATRSVLALDPAHGCPESELPAARRRLAEYRTRGAEAGAEFVASAFSDRSPPGLRAAHVLTMLGTPGHVVAQSYAGMYLNAGAVGPRRAAEAYLRRRARPALTVWTSAPYAAWERAVADSRVEYWPHTGHYLHEERPERTIRTIRDWAGSENSTVHHGRTR